MSKKKFVVLGPGHPFPLRALWLLLESHEIPSDEDGFARPGCEDMLRAHQAVAHWFAEVNGREDLSFSDNDTPIELHRDQARIGVCPFCFQNDGHQDEGDEDYWGFARSTAPGGRSTRRKSRTRRSRHPHGLSATSRSWTGWSSRHPLGPPAPPRCAS